MVAFLSPMKRFSTPPSLPRGPGSLGKGKKDISVVDECWIPELMSDNPTIIPGWQVVVTYGCGDVMYVCGDYNDARVSLLHHLPGSVILCFFVPFM